MTDTPTAAQAATPPQPESTAVKDARTFLQSPENPEDYQGQYVEAVQYLKALLTTMEAAEARASEAVERIKQLEANQRTPGTVEVCQECGAELPADTSGYWRRNPTLPTTVARCPIRQQVSPPASESGGGLE